MFLITDDIIENLRSLRKDIEDQESVLFKTNLPLILTQIIEKELQVNKRRIN